MALRNYVLGRGEVYLAEHDADENPMNWRYVGATREMNLTAETEDLEHTDPDRGINEVDARVQLSVTRTGTMIMEDIQSDNLALFFFGSKSAIATRADDAADQTDTIDGDRLGRILDDGYEDNSEILIGVTALDPIGSRDVLEMNLALAGMNSAGVPAAVALVKGTDWDIVDLEDVDPGAAVKNVARRGAIRLLNTVKTFQPATDDDVLSEIEVTYRRAALAGHDQILSGTAAFTGALKFIEFNPEGKNNDWSLPKIQLSPNGDLSLKAEEWRQVPFSISIQKPAADGVEALYINGAPAR